MPLLPRLSVHEQKVVPLPGRVISVSISLTTLVIISVCLSRRIPEGRRWGKLPPVLWLLNLIYADSFIFIFLSTVLRHLGVNSSHGLCQGAILVCLACYLTTKVLLYLFLVEKAYIVRGVTKRRHEDKLYLFNAGVMLIPFAVVAVLNFVYRIGYINKYGVCIIGMENKALIPLSVFDVIANVYLTILFVVPLRNSYSYKTVSNPALRSMVTRTFIGSCLTLLSCVVNLVASMIMHGEPGWVCLFACNLDILFDILILHWVTVSDKNKLNETTGAASKESTQRKSALSQSSEKGTQSVTHTSIDIDSVKGLGSRSTHPDMSKISGAEDTEMGMVQSGN